MGIKNDTPFYRCGHQKRHFSFYRGGHQNGISIFAQVGIKNCIKFYRGGHQNGISIFAQVGIENCIQFLQRWASKTAFHFYRGGNPKRHSIFTEVIIIKNRAICEGRQGSLQNDLWGAAGLPSGGIFVGGRVHFRVNYMRGSRVPFIMIWQGFHQSDLWGSSESYCI